MIHETIAARLTGRHKRAHKMCEVKGKTILDIGCSFGWFEKLALEDGAKRVVGIEPEEKDLENARRDAPGAEFKTASAFKLPFRDGEFDMVVMFDVLEHIPKSTEDQAMKEIWRVLKTGGELVLSTPFRSLISSILDPAWYFGHRHYSKNRIAKLLKDAGFKIDKIETGGGWWDLLGLVLFYICKWIFRLDIPWKEFWKRKTEEEYLHKKRGFMTLFIKAGKIE